MKWLTYWAHNPETAGSNPVPAPNFKFMESRNERLTRRSQEIGTKHQRKLRKYSNGFNEKFTFFLLSYRKGILTFCGSIVDIDKGETEAKESFRMFEDGQFKHINPVSKHTNLLQCIIIAKKAWGLWVDQWSDGIVDWTFTKEEILAQFTDNGITIPESFLRDFDNVIERKKSKRYIE